MLTCLQGPPLTNYRVRDSAILHLGLLLQERCSHLALLGMSAEQSLDRSGNEGDERATRGSSEYVCQKYLRIGRMEVGFNSRQVKKKLAAERSPQSARQRVAEHPQVEMSSSARDEVARGNAAHDLQNQTRNIHENISACTAKATCHSAIREIRMVAEKKPALRRQRILWRRRVGDASAKPTSAVKVLEKSEIMSHLPSHRNNLHPSRAQSEDCLSSL